MNKNNARCAVCDIQYSQPTAFTACCREIWDAPYESKTKHVQHPQPAQAQLNQLSNQVSYLVTLTNIVTIVNIYLFVDQDMSIESDQLVTSDANNAAEMVRVLL